VRLPFLSRGPDYVLQPLTGRDSAALSQIHAEDFVRPWAAAEFESLLAQNTVFGFGAHQPGAKKRELHGFVLARAVAGEAEILTVAVARAARRRGLGRTMMDAVLSRLHALRAEALFLEVDETNIAALALYRKLGFREVGRRDGYYADRSGRKSAALVMRRDLR